MAAPVTVTIDRQVWFDTYQDLRKFEPALAIALRRNLKEIAGRAAEAVKQEIKDASGTLGSDDLAAIEAGVSAKVSFTKRSAGVKIVASASKLPSADKGLVKALELKRFRHPIFGTDKWAEQDGHPYFGAAIGKTIDSDLLNEIDAAMDAAITAIGARNV